MTESGRGAGAEAADLQNPKSIDLSLPKEALRIRGPTRLRRAMDLEGEPNARHEAGLHRIAAGAKAEE